MEKYIPQRIVVMSGWISEFLVRGGAKSISVFFFKLHEILWLVDQVFHKLDEIGNSGNSGFTTLVKKISNKILRPARICMPGYLCHSSYMLIQLS